jgi:hypothetical protein
MAHGLQPLTTHTLTAGTGTGATRTSAFADGVSSIMVTVTADCFIAFESATPTATTASTFVTSGWPYTFYVPPAGITAASGHKLAAITGTGASTVYVTELGN